MSTTINLVIDHIAQNQKKKELDANNGFNILDQAIATVGTHAIIKNQGHTVQEASTWTAGAVDRKVGQQTIFDVAGDVVEIQASFDSAGTGNAKGVIYTLDANGDPDALMGSSDAVVNPVVGWNTFAFSTPVAITPGNYVVGIIADFNFVLDRLSGGFNIWWNNDTYSDGAADPWGTLNAQTETLSLYAKVSLLSSNVWTMSDAQMRDAMHIVNGVLVANTEIVVPNRSKLYCIFNNTTGAFNLDIKTAAGAGTRITQTSKAWMFCNGTDVLPVTNTGATKL